MSPTRNPVANLPVGSRLGVPFTRPVSCGAQTCQVRLDVYAPATPGSYPAVVLVRGGPSGIGGRTGLGGFAAALAARGHVVFNADMRDLARAGGGYPAAFDDVACAVRFARDEAARYGGDSSRVILVGHSLGGWVGSVVALGAERDDSACLAGGSGRPDAFVGLAGNYDLTARAQFGDLLAFFGGGAVSTAPARSASDPLAVTPARLPVRLVAGTNDEVVDPAASAALEKRLEAFGLDTALLRVPGGTHVSLVDLAANGSVSLATVDDVGGELEQETDRAVATGRAGERPE